MAVCGCNFIWQTCWLKNLQDKLESDQNQVSLMCGMLKRIKLKESYREGKKLGQLRVAG